MEKLAIKGGQPVRKKKLFYGRQWIEDDDIEAVVETLRSDFITSGPKAQQLSKELCKYTGSKYGFVLANGTAALHCACIAAGIGPGDEVITTPLTFMASANCALYCGARPVFADIDSDTYNIDPKSIEEHITGRTKAVIAVDFTGQAVRVKEILEICRKYRIVFIEDAAHSIGTKYEGTPIGSLADITCFSFHPVKNITGGEGGAVLTNSKAFYKRAFLAANHGIAREEEDMVALPHEGPWEYEQVSLGYNYRMTDFQAALLLSQFNKLERFKQRRRVICQRYDEAFANTPGIVLQKEIQESDTCRHLYIIRLDLDKLTCSRTEFFEAMSAENIQPQVHYVPTYFFPYYRSQGYVKGLCPNAEAVYKCIMSIPLYPKMTDDDVEDVIKAVKKVCEAYRR